MARRLHCFGESGNAYKCALAMEMSGAAWEPVHVDFFRGATRSQEFRALSVMGEVPVLEEDGGLVITQSGLILDHVARVTGALGGTDEAERREIWRWILFDAQKISGQAGPLRFNMNFLPEAKRDAGANDYLAMRLRSALGVLETHLGARDWVVGDAPTIADCALCGYLYYDEDFTFDRADWPAIDAWLTRLSARPGWRHPYELMTRAFPG